MSTPWQRRLAVGVFGTAVCLILAGDVFQIMIARELGRSPLSTSDGTLAYSVVLLTFPMVGLLLTRRQPSNAIGWLLLCIGLCWGIREFLFADYLTWTLSVRPGSLPGAGIVGALAFPLWVPQIGLMGTFLILLFPDGALPSPRWRWLGWACAVTMTGLYLVTVVRPGPVLEAPVDDLRNPLAIDALAPAVPVFDFAVTLLPLCILGCAVGLVIRFRRSEGVESLQLKWLAAAGSFVAAGYLVLILRGTYAQLTGLGPEPGWVEPVTQAFFVSFALIPISIGIAVLKHGLYEIDRLISRTVSYAVVTGTLVVVYVLLVTLVSRLTPSSSSVAVAASTLAVAAMFQPLRGRVQGAVDRRFNRSRYDAEDTVRLFSRRLRSEVDLAEVCADLLTVVQQTVEPAAAGIWLRPVSGGSA